MIRWNAQDVAKSHGITSAYELALQCGLPYSSARRIWHGTAKRLDIYSLDKLCSALGAEIGDLLKREGDNNDPD